MGVPLADLGVNRVNLDDKVKPALPGIFRIKKNITGEIHELTPYRGECIMLDVKVKIGMDRINFPLLGHDLQGHTNNEKQEKKYTFFHGVLLDLDKHFLKPRPLEFFLKKIWLKLIFVKFTVLTFDITDFS